MCACQKEALVSGNWDGLHVPHALVGRTYLAHLSGTLWVGLRCGTGVARDDLCEESRRWPWCRRKWESATRSGRQENHGKENQKVGEISKMGWGKRVLDRL
jgi:hypothetical protein